MTGLRRWSTWRASGPQTGGIRNVEFRQLELEWIDLETASVDGVLCRWGIMLIVDPAAAAQEIRRVLRPGKRAAFAVWDAPERNPWATIPSAVMIRRGHAQPPEPDAPGHVRAGCSRGTGGAARRGWLHRRDRAAHELARHYAEPAGFMAETADMSPLFGAAYEELPAEEREAIGAEVIAALEPFTAR